MPRRSLFVLSGTLIVTLAGAALDTGLLAQSRIDAAVEFDDPLLGPGVIFFQGSEYVRYDILRNRVAARGLIRDLFTALPSPFTERVDAAAATFFGPVGNRNGRKPPPGVVFFHAELFLTSGDRWLMYHLDWDGTITLQPVARMSATLVQQGVFMSGSIPAILPAPSYKAMYIDRWRPGTLGPGLYLLNDDTYIVIPEAFGYTSDKNRFIRGNTMARGYPGFPYRGIASVDAAYVDRWSYSDKVRVSSDLTSSDYWRHTQKESPQLYIFSGTRYARYDMKKNQFMSVNDVSTGFPGVLIPR